MATSKQLDDITECPICTEVYTDPRSLPCVHTFCLKCLETYCKDKQPGDKLACPLCRKEFTLPSNGVSDLPKNFFVGNFLQMKELSSVESKMSPCGQHSDKKLEIYCFDCKLAICILCYFKSHKDHKCSDVSEVDDEFRKHMTTDFDIILAGVDKCKEMLQSLDKEKDDFSEQIRKMGTEISEKAEKLKQMIDDHKEKLMNELSSMKQKRMKEIESLREKIERQLMSMESYKKYVDELRQKGTACDIARAASGLHDRADELLKFDVIKRTLADLGHADVTFTSSNYVIDDVNKTLGQLHLNTLKGAMKSRVPTLTHVIPSQGRGFVSAVTSLGDDVFVGRKDSKQVEVYDAETFTLQRHITVPGLGLCSLTACAVNHCIYMYASDWDNDSIHRVELSGSNAVTKWSVARWPNGLSVNKAHNLVVACNEAKKLQEYTTDGSLVREICLQRGVSNPFHAIQLSIGHYVVSQCKSPGVVSVVGVDGQVIHSYGQSQTSDVGQMRYPSSLAVTKNDDILVADERNNRILSIIRSTGCVQELALSVDFGIQGPRGLCLDESRGRLYVGEVGEVGLFGQCRVLVFDGVFI